MAAMKERKSRFSEVRRILSENQWVYIIIGLMAGLLLPRLLTIVGENINGFLDNLVPEFFGMVFTIVIIDRLDKEREDRLIKEQLVRQMHSRYNPMALQAIEELRILGYLGDGSIAGMELRGSEWRDANLYRADLRNCDLRNAKLNKADLVEADLTGSNLTDEQLVTTDIMLKAIMPDGKLYNGRFNLHRDFELAKKWGHDLNDPESMAKYYNVSVEDYLEGQAWAAENLDKLRQKILQTA